MGKIWKKILIIAIVFSANVVPLTTKAVFSNPIWGGRNAVNCNISGATPCTVCDAAKVMANVSDFLVQLSIAVGILMMVVGGILVMLHGANPRMYQQGMNAVKMAVFGIAIALGAWLIINTVITVLTGSNLDAIVGQLNC